MAVIDFHAHILPGIDDGSDSIGKSLEMYHLSKAHGVDLIAATPHFYALRDRVDDFLNRREEAFQKLCTQDHISDGDMVLGAEVAYFRGISEAEKLPQLTMQGTNKILLELPFEPWKDAICEEIQYMINERGLEVILAHLERYLTIAENKKQMKQMLSLPVYVQVNAGSLIDWRRRRGTLKLLKQSPNFVLGSDMHGVRHRPPNLSEGREVLRKAFGAGALAKMDAIGEELCQRRQQSF